MSRIAEIDRKERIDVLYDQRGTQLLAWPVRSDAPAWDPHGNGAHSVEAQVRTVEHYFDAGGAAVGAFGERQPGWRRGRRATSSTWDVAAGVPSRQRAVRATGIGSRLSEEVEQIARTAGDSEVVVSATPSENTVRFYLGRGFQPMAEPLTELLQLEPADVHMLKVL